MLLTLLQMLLRVITPVAVVAAAVAVVAVMVMMLRKAVLLTSSHILSHKPQKLKLKLSEYYQAMTSQKVENVGHWRTQKYVRSHEHSGPSLNPAL